MQSGSLLVAVERIAQDGSIQTLLMGTMHTQLVGSARLGIEGDAEMGAVDALQDFILRNGLLALLVIHYLAGAVQIIGLQRKGDDSLFRNVSSQNVFFRNDGDVFLLHPMVQKLLL